ncbi:MAG: glycerol-3-phosphate acyltransferase, partial [Myxococcales bacterium]
KGVATGLGVALALAPLAALAGAAVWIAAYAVVRISSVGSLAGTAAALVCAGATANRSAFFAMAAIACLIAIRHRTNVARLLTREETDKR